MVGTSHIENQQKIAQTFPKISLRQEFLVKKDKISTIGAQIGAQNLPQMNGQLDHFDPSAGRYSNEGGKSATVVAVSNFVLCAHIFWTRVSLDQSSLHSKAT